MLTFLNCYSILENSIAFSYLKTPKNNMLLHVDFGQEGALTYLVLVSWQQHQQHKDLPTSMADLKSQEDVGMHMVE